MDLMSTIAPIGEPPQIVFSWIDYSLFVAILGLSAAIGIYYGCCGRKQDTANEYLLGGKTMRIFPIAMSLTASNLSGIAILAVPADVYKFGGTYWWTCVAIIVSSIIGVYVFLPVFLNLHITTTHEYLKFRFDNKIRVLSSFLFTMTMFLFNPIVIYIPALAFAQVTGFKLYVVIPIVCIICIFYTAIGGLKAVVWTDTLQSLVIAGSITAILIIGITSIGNISDIWTKSIEGHRLDIFDFNIDPTARNTIWAIGIGASVQWIYFMFLCQTGVQRFMAVPSIHHAKKAVLFFTIGIVIVKTMLTLTGLVMYTKYSGCDPLSTKQVLRGDQLLPYFVMDVAEKIPGLPGLFITGVFSAGLSTLSTTLNTLSGTIYEDFLSPFMPLGTTQRQKSNILKLLVLILGVISTALVFVVQHLDGMLPLAISMAGITGGPIVGLYCLGMIFPSANSKGALVGGIVGLMFTSWMVIGNLVCKGMGLVKDSSKPLSTKGCHFYFNTTLSSPQPPAPVFILYRITFWYYSVLGAVVVVIIGLVVSWLTKKDEPPVHPDLISPVVHYFFPSVRETVSAPPEYLDLTNALHLVALNSEKETEVNSI